MAIFFFLFLLHSTTQTPTVAQTPSSPPNITTILSQTGQFNTLTTLLKSTQIANQINNQLNNSNNGITIFAPTDTAFSNLPPGTLNSLSDQQKVSLIQFHIIPSLIPISQFPTVTNPLRTLAGTTTNGQFPLNVTGFGNQVNISTGVVNTSVSNVVYSDGKIEVYQVERVLLPLAIFGSGAEAPGPSDLGSGRKKRRADAPDGRTDFKPVADSSSGFGFGGIERGIWVGFVVLGSLFWLNL